MAAAEQKKSYAVVKTFQGVDTKANRTAIKEDEFSWLENAMPIGYANLKITPTYSNVGGIAFANTVTNFYSLNIGLTDYLLAFQKDGSLQAVNVQTQTLSNVAGAGYFTGDGLTNVGQWQNTNALIADSAKGLFSWDGTNLVSVGSVGAIGIKNPGSGYTSAPAVTISAPNQTGGQQAFATASITANAVSAITLTNAGSGYTSPPTVTLSGGGGTGANAVAEIITFATGTLAVLVTSGGAGYSNASNVVVTISGGGGTNAAGTAIISGNIVTEVIMSNYGSGYSNVSNVSVTISGGGATTNATANAVILTSPTVGVASFSGRVWVAQGRTITYSSAVSFTDFSTVSAGQIVLSDSTLHGNIQQLLSANNFLYIFGDDSINVFSNVQVQSNGSTIFTNTNVSASVGSKRANSIFPYFRSVLFMNDYGVYALVGSTTSKLSDPLDGIFPYIDFTKPVSAGQVLLNNILCAAFNFYYTGGQGTSSASRYMQAIFFEKKWFFTSADPALLYVTSAPVSGKINLYGTNGTSCVQLYSNSAGNVSSYVQTALMPMGDPIRTKQATKVGIEATLTTGATLNATIDSEVLSESLPYLSATTFSGWLNSSNVLIPWVNNSNVTITWLISSGYQLYKSDASNWGKYLGVTVTSNSAAFVINGFEFEHELRVRF
jgi:hypothetical protein